MIKTQSILEAKVNDKCAQLTLDSAFTLGEVHDALHQMLQYIVGLIEDAAKKAAPAAVAQAVAQSIPASPSEPTPPDYSAPAEVVAAAQATANVTPAT